MFGAGALMLALVHVVIRAYDDYSGARGESGVVATAGAGGP